MKPNTEQKILIKICENTDQVGKVEWTYLEESLAAAMKLHAEADAAGLTGAGELTEQGSQDGAGQRLLQQGQSHDHTVQKWHTDITFKD